MATYHILGVPLRSGSLMPGSENDAKAYRDVGLVGRLRAAGCQAVDDGDVAIPSYLPHHAIPPIRSWPGPRIAWECVAERIAPILARSSSRQGARTSGSPQRPIRCTVRPCMHDVAGPSGSPCF